MLQLGICLIIAALIGIDQLTKWLAIVYLRGADPLVVLNGILSFNYTENTGAAWSLFEGQQWLLVGGTSVMLLGLLAVLLSGMFRNYKLVIVGGILVVSGGLGNLIDRIFRGFVVDFIQVDFIDFPIFNFADCLVVVGAIWLFIYFVFIYSDPSDTGENKKRFKKKTKELQPNHDHDQTVAGGDGEKA